MQGKGGVYLCFENKAGSARRRELCMIYRNATIVDGTGAAPHTADLRTEGDRIVKIGQGLEGDETLDCTGKILTPGFVDIHIHGCVGVDTCDGDPQALGKMAAHLATCGVTAFCPTTMTVSDEEICAAVRTVRAAVENPPAGAVVLGVNMEGPFINPAKKGAQKEEFVRAPSISTFRRYWAESDGTIKLVDIAPEQPGAHEFLRGARELCTVSIAHTEANYDQATWSFRHGVTHATHLFNAMPGLTHRAPGTVGAVFDSSRVTAELICDGFHIHPAALRVAFNLLKGRICVISDSMRAAGLSDGVYDLGGQAVTVKGKTALLADGTIAGSVTNLHQELKNLVSYGVPMEEALRAMTLTPAREIGLDQEIGTLEPGKRADIVVLDKDLEIVHVFHTN